MAAVRNDPGAITYVPYTLQTREIMELAMRDGNELNFRAIGNAATALAMLLEQPQLLGHIMVNMHSERRNEIYTAVLTADGSVFQYLPYSIMLNLIWVRMAAARTAVTSAPSAFAI